MTTLYALSEVLGQQLLANHLKVTTAESCTGGGIAQLITAVPGSSQWFDQSWVTYSNKAKANELGVSVDDLRALGAVSQPVVEAMAIGARAKARAHWAVAVSGVAGPDGGTPEKPVGTVWVAWAGPGLVEAKCFHFHGDRDAVRTQTIQSAVQGLLELINASV